jgi:peptide/nickel transport system permease protein
MFVLALAGPVLTPYRYQEMHIRDKLQSPNPTYPLGTDQFGRDILSRIANGARISLTVGVICTGIALLAGILIGLVSGYFGSWVDEAMMRVMDILMALPSIVLTIALIALMGTSFVNLILIIGITGIPQFARVTRSSVLGIKEMEFVTAARAIGQSNGLILLRHILPSCLTPLVVLASLYMPTAISTEASLSFLGLGIQPPMPSWGGMLSEGRAFVLNAPWMAIFPGLAISLTILGYNLLGDGLRDMLDPRTRKVVE